jgi:hypothetical protein
MVGDALRRSAQFRIGFEPWPGRRVWSAATRRRFQKPDATPYRQLAAVIALARLKPIIGLS